MKMKKKGKVYPSPPPPSSSSSSPSSHYLNEDDSLSVLRLLPATILVLVSVLSAEDREVLAYLITRGTTISAIGSCGSSYSSSSPSVDSKKMKKKNKSSKTHKPPVFNCECFDCYTNYWFRWDSSPNRELIHEIIEAFESHHLTTGGGENSASRSKSKRGKKKEKPIRTVADKEDTPVAEVEVEHETTVSESHVSSPDNSPGRLSEAEVAEREPRDEKVVAKEEEEESTVVFPATVHKGLARKVLPDVLGLFNSNFWRLWNPNA
ncbi:unnamed protein product [Microthlaspi erraticum]|uniref:Uncharacterized protein n=1 Tax=Microthlaspi erraticum TaxID=1685480 RepID=A0A6D2JJ62_9BRAS|nr:unnamed protein product [Microthlaspi erraticum]